MVGRIGRLTTVASGGASGYQEGAPATSIAQARVTDADFWREFVCEDGRHLPAEQYFGDCLLDRKVKQGTPLTTSGLRARRAGAGIRTCFLDGADVSPFMRQ